MIDVEHLGAALKLGRVAADMTYFLHAMTPGGVHWCAEMRTVVGAKGQWLLLATSLATGRKLHIGGDERDTAADLIVKMAEFMASDEGEEAADGTMRAN
ncbi:MAG TPA: hypothetical protein VFQ80_00355 [Thermomicrobiales bacterium]|jgi:hypothetical protein|nr:hypothetical protein [Thermomicrobiales bacterium]